MTERLQNILLKHILPGALIVYFGLGFVLWNWQTNFLYFPSDQDFATCEKLATAERIGNNSMRGYFQNTSDTIVVVYHGNAGSACDRAWYVEELFSPLNLSYLLVEYTGYSNDGKEPSADALRTNVDDTINFLETKDYKPENIIIVSESIGSGAASYHLSQQDVATAIFSTPFNRLWEVAQSHYPLYPAQLLLSESFDNHAKLKDSSAAIHIIHGDNDTLIPLKQAEDLFTSLQTDQKTLTVVPGAGHNDIYHFPIWYDTVYDILRQHASSTN